MSKTVKIAIVGGGSSGLFLAKKLSENPCNAISVFEKNGKIGTKLKASGGGKANILNADILEHHYNDTLFMSRFLQKVDSQTIQREFAEMGLKMSTDEEGRIYPATYFSQTVLDVLLRNLSPQTTIYYDYQVNKIIPAGGKWKINEYPVLFDKVVLASGSPAGMIAANRKNYNHYLFSFDLKISDFVPSLVGFKIKNYYQKLSGCRTKAIVSLCQNNKEIFKEKGEIIFKDDGVSGIVILNSSAYYNRLKDKRNCSLVLNFLYDDENYNVEEHWQKYHSFCGILHPKLNEWYEKEPFDLQHLELKIAAPYSLEFAQVCSGGIDVSEIGDDFQLKKYPNLYVTGELLNIDGVCGGYNLFFAFASAYQVATQLNHEN